jgi:antitoxin (DNA-binding transcriptional repressor) of toxin-antitoxin stability system
MRTVSPLDLRRSLGSILDAASAGERFMVERDHRPLAMLVSIEEGRRLEPDAAQARTRRFAALDHLEALAARVPAGRVPPRPAQSEATPTPAARAAPTAPSSPEPRPEEDRDRHRLERQRHADEGLVGLG